MTPVALRRTTAWPVAGQEAGRGSLLCVNAPSAPTRAGVILARFVGDDSWHKAGKQYEVSYGVDAECVRSKTKK